jgi:hypothetical protein
MHCSAIFTCCSHSQAGAPQDWSPETPAALTASPLSPLHKAAAAKGEIRGDDSLPLDTQPSPLWRSQLLRFLKTAAGSSSAGSTPIAAGAGAPGRQAQGGGQDSSHEGEEAYDYPLVGVL